MIAKAASDAKKRLKCVLNNYARYRCRSLCGIERDEPLSLLDHDADFYGLDESVEYPADSSTDDSDELNTADSPSAM